MKRSLYLAREPWALVIGLFAILAEGALWLSPRHRRFRRILLSRYPAGLAPNKPAEQQAWRESHYRP